MKYAPSIPNKDGLLLAVLRELKQLGIKIPKLKKYSSNKQEKNNSSLFGSSLSCLPAVLVDDNGLQVPKFLADILSVIQKNLEAEGLFRKAGSISRQKELRQNLQNGIDLNNVHVYDLASLVKQFLRELPEALIVPRLQEHFIRAQNLEDVSQRQTALFLLCILLPNEHLHVLRYLMQFLRIVAANSSLNKMDAYNLALVMTPNLMHFSDKTDKGNNKFLQCQTEIIHSLIKNANKIGMVDDQFLENIGLITSFSQSEDDLEKSGEYLEPPKSTKKQRLSGSINGVFNNIRKMVNVRTPSHLSDFQTPLKTIQSSDRSSSKRKAEEESIYLTRSKNISTTCRRAVMVEGHDQCVKAVSFSPELLKTPVHYKTSLTNLQPVCQSGDTLFTLGSSVQKTPKVKQKHKLFSPARFHKRITSSKGSTSEKKERSRKSSLNKQPLGIKNDKSEKSNSEALSSDSLIQDQKVEKSCFEKSVTTNLMFNFSSMNSNDISADQIKNQLNDEMNVSNIKIDISKNGKELPISLDSRRIDCIEDVQNVRTVSNDLLNSLPDTEMKPSKDSEKFSEFTNSDLSKKLKEELKIKNSESSKSLFRKVGSFRLRDRRSTSMKVPESDGMLPPTAAVKRTHSVHGVSHSNRPFNKRSIRRGKPNTVNTGLPSPFKVISEPVRIVHCSLDSNSYSNVKLPNNINRKYLKDDVFEDNCQMNSLKERTETEHNFTNSLTENSVEAISEVGITEDDKQTSTCKNLEEVDSSTTNAESSVETETLGDLFLHNNNSEDLSLIKESEKNKENDFTYNKLETTNKDTKMFCTKHKDRIHKHLHELSSSITDFFSEQKKVSPRSFLPKQEEQINTCMQKLSKTLTKLISHRNSTDTKMFSRKYKEKVDACLNELIQSLSKVCENEGKLKIDSCLKELSDTISKFTSHLATANSLTKLQETHKKSFTWSNSNQTDKRLKLNKRHSTSEIYSYTGAKFGPLTQETLNILTSVGEIKVKTISPEKSLDKKERFLKPASVEDIPECDWKTASSVLDKSLSSDLKSTGRPSIIRIKKECAGKVSASIQRYDELSRSGGKSVSASNVRLPTTPQSPVRVPSIFIRNSNKSSSCKNASSRNQETKTSAPKLPMTDYLRRRSFNVGNNSSSAVQTRSQTKAANSTPCRLTSVKSLSTPSISASSSRSNATPFRDNTKINIPKTNSAVKPNKENDKKTLVNTPSIKRPLLHTDPNNLKTPKKANSICSPQMRQSAKATPLKASRLDVPRKQSLRYNLKNSPVI